MEEIKGLGYKITPTAIMFLDRTAHKKFDGSWKFDVGTAKKIHFKTVEEVYADFLKKMETHKQYKGSYSKISLLNISPYHAIALYVYGIITDELFERVEEADTRAYTIIGNDNGMPILQEIPVSEEISSMYFAKQDITFNDKTFQSSILVTSSLIELHMHIAAVD